jgi:murein DD-endopeptidase MepM/ murein hydrolase activator NlpD
VSPQGSRYTTVVLTVVLTILIAGSLLAAVGARSGWWESRANVSTSSDAGNTNAPSTSRTSPVTPSTQPPAPTRRGPSAALGSEHANPDSPRRQQLNTALRSQVPEGGRLLTRHEFPVADCSTSYADAHHDYPAADIFAARGCLFISPVAGRVDEANRVDRWNSRTNRGADRGGLYVSIAGVDGVRYYGAHLEQLLPDVRPGLVVKAGTPLGRIGDSGSAHGVGTHLHFGLSWPTPHGYWWIRRGTVAPAAFLEAWRAGRQDSPTTAVLAAKHAYGNDSRCHAYC